jgi:hypothetical protein
LKIVILHALLLKLLKAFSYFVNKMSQNSVLQRPVKMCMI